MRFGGGFGQGLMQGAAFAEKIGDVLDEGEKKKLMKEAAEANAMKTNVEEMAGPAQEGEAAPTRTSYSVGDQTFYDKGLAQGASTKATISAMSDVYRKLGKPEEAMKMDVQARQLDAMDKQGRMTDFQLAKYERDDAAMKEMLGVIGKDPRAYLKDQYDKNQGAYGQGEHKDLQVNYHDDGKGGTIAWRTDKDGNHVGEAIYATPDQIRTEAMRQYLGKTDPKELYKFDSDEKYRNAMLQHQADVLKETGRHNVETEKTSRITANASLLTARAHQGAYGAQQKLLEAQLAEVGKQAGIPLKDIRAMEDQVSEAIKKSGGSPEETQGAIRQLGHIAATDPEGFAKLIKKNTFELATHALTQHRLNTLVNKDNEGLTGLRILGNKPAYEGVRKWTFDPANDEYLDELSGHKVSRSKVEGWGKDYRLLLDRQAGVAPVVAAAAKDKYTQIEAQRELEEGLRRRRLTEGPWYAHDLDTDLVNDEGTPNIVANGLNSARNFFARTSRQARGE